MILANHTMSLQMEDKLLPNQKGHIVRQSKRIRFQPKRMKNCIYNDQKFDIDNHMHSLCRRLSRLKFHQELETT